MEIVWSLTVQGWSAGWSLLSEGLEKTVWLAVASFLLSLEFLLGDFKSY